MLGFCWLAELLVASHETCFMELVKISGAYYLYYIWTVLFAVHTWKLALPDAAETKTEYRLKVQTLGN
jgi:hypothetical protein